jgi:UDP-N-acetylmuramyl pentapeptide phosphotransferase/UDP-N-acetylglucosamine-1-phosphate transferase
VGGIRFAVPMLLFAAAMPAMDFFLGGSILGITESLRVFYWLVLIGVGGAFALGFWDDARTAPARVKFAGQIAVAAVSVALLEAAPVRHPFQNWAETLLSGEVALWAGRVIAFGWIIFMMNAFNFMDGINGFAAVFAIGVLIGFAAMLGRATGETEAVYYCLFCIGTLIAFLVSNAPGHEFMGDCGSQFLGFVLAAFALAWNAPAGAPTGPTAIPFEAGVLMLLPFIYDVVRTLLVRAGRGERLWLAHRDHLYQRLVRIGWPHLKVVMYNIPFFTICVLMGYVFAASTTNFHRILTIIIAAGSLYLYNRLVIHKTSNLS